jgi:hypothetical protein
MNVYAIMCDVWNVAPDVLTPAERLVLLRLAFHANADGTSIYPAMASVARYTGLTVRGVRKAMRRLEAIGFIATDGAGPRRTTQRKLNLKTIQRATPKGEHSSSPHSSTGQKGEHSSPTRGNTVPLKGEHSSPKETLKKPTEEKERAIAVCSVGSLSSKGEPAEEQPPRDWQAEMRRYKAESPGWNRGIVTSATS